MTYFSEVLDEMMQQYHLRAVDICSQLTISTSLFSKWRTGVSLPGDMATVKQLAEIMRLSIREKDEFFSAYKLSRFGISFHHITESIEHLFLSDFVCRKRSSTDMAQYPPPENGKFLTNKGRVMVAVRQLIRYSGGNLKMIFLPEDDDVCNVIREELQEQGSKCKWLMYLNNVGDVSPENVSMFFHAFPLMLDGHEVRYSYINLRGYYEYSPFPFLLITDTAILSMNRDCSAGMIFHDENYIRYCNQLFSLRYQKASLLGKCFGTPEEFLTGHSEVLGHPPFLTQSELYIVEKRPCVIYEADSKALLQHIADFPDKAVLAKKYMEFLHFHLQNVTRTHTIFSVEGLREFFEEDAYYELCEKLSNSIPLQARKKLMRLFIGHAERNSDLEPNLLLHSFLDHSRIRVVNIWSDGRIIFILDLDDDFRVLTIREPSLAHSLIAYLDYLKECETMLSKDATMRRLYDAWEKYGNI